MLDAAEFAKTWIGDWNNHELDAILSHYAENARFNSPFAERLTGNGSLEGQSQLRAYWSQGLKRRPDLHFEFIGQYLGYKSMSVHYSDEAGRTAIETMVFDDDGKILISTACYDRLK